MNHQIFDISCDVNHWKCKAVVMQEHPLAQFRDFNVDTCWVRAEQRVKQTSVHASIGADVPARSQGAHMEVTIVGIAAKLHSIGNLLNSFSSSMLLHWKQDAMTFMSPKIWKYEQYQISTS